MKKLLAIFAAAVMITPMAFALDFSIGWRALGVAQVIGNSESGVGNDEDRAWTQWSDNIRLNFNLVNPAGTAGASFRFIGEPWQSLNTTWFQAWWQPNDMFYFAVGKIEENRRFNPEPLRLEWGLFSAFNQNFDVAYYMRTIQFAPWDAWQDIGPDPDNIHSGLRAGSDRVGVQFSVIPRDDLHFTFVWNGFETSPTFAPFHSPALDVLWGSLGVNVTYTTPFGGDVALFFNNATEEVDAEPADRRFRHVSLLATQQITNPLYAEASVLLPLPVAENADIPFIGFGIGLGYRVNRMINVNARIGGEIGLVDTVHTAGGILVSGHSTKFGFDIVPSIALNYTFRVFLPVGFAIDVDAEVVGWSFTPFLTIDAGWVSFWTGFRIWADNSHSLRIAFGDPSISWAIPVGLLINW